MKRVEDPSPVCVLHAGLFCQEDMMTHHDHRPTFKNFSARNERTVCTQCGRPLNCTNVWLNYLPTLPLLFYFIFFSFVMPNTIEPKLFILLFFCLGFFCSLLQRYLFRFLRFEVDIVAERDVNRRDFLGRFR